MLKKKLAVDNSKAFNSKQSEQKELSEMSFEELWRLFPIILTEHNECWAELFSQEKKRLLSFLPSAEVLRIHHVGSTAIEGIWAKPIVDILIEIPNTMSMDAIQMCLIHNGYTCMHEEEYRRIFNMGYTKEGFADKVFHLHLRCLGDNDELYFRDYMNDNPELAHQYESLKLSLWEKFEHDRDAYTAAKTGFIKSCTEKARKQYEDRYE